jgi:ribonuclease HI
MTPSSIHPTLWDYPKEKMPGSEAEIYSDGASLGNPGHSGIGVVIRFLDKPGKDMHISEYIGMATNNIAEYSALIKGLRKVSALGLKKITIYMDSELLVKQLQGTYRIRSATLRPFWEEARGMLQQFEGYTINHIRREFNKEADQLAKRAAKREKS